MDRLLTSLRYTIRLLLKSPGFAITAILILGFGIGVNAAIFSLIDSVLLQPLPFPQADRLVQIDMPHGNASRGGLDYLDYLDIRAAQRSFDGLCVSHGDFLDLRGPANPERLAVSFVSNGLFNLSGRPFILGRPFTDQEDVPHGRLVAVLSERFWHSHFNADPGIIGKNVTLSDQTFEVIGVAPNKLMSGGRLPSTFTFRSIQSPFTATSYINERLIGWVVLED
jgi:hypothetical protein